MLRKKLAKFLLSIAIVGVSSGSVLGYQQALASQVTPEIQVSATMEGEFEIVEDKLAMMPIKTVADELGQAVEDERLKSSRTTADVKDQVNGGKSEIEQLKEALANTNVTTINIDITMDMNLDATTLGELSTRLQSGPLTINFKKGSFLMKTAGLKLDGASKLTITRDAANTKPVIDCSEDATISGITFVDPATTPVNAFVKIAADKNINVKDNTVTGILLDTKPTANVANINGNIFTAGSKLYVDQVAITMTITSGSIGSEYVDAVFGVDQAGLTTGLSIKDIKLSIKNGNTDVETVNNDALPEGTNQLTYIFETGLNPNTQYTVTATAEVTLDGNTYQGITSTNTTDFRTLGELALELSNITSNSATITLKGSYVVNTPGGLTLGLSSTATGAAIPKPITQTASEFKLTGLSSNTEYTYSIFDGRTLILTGTFRTLPVSGSGSTITGGTSSSSSSTSYEIKTTDINKATIKDVTASIPVSTTNLANSMRDGKNFSTNVEGVTVKYSNGNVELVGLVPEKQYKNFIISYTDKNGTSRKVTVATFTTKVSETKLRQFIVDVYKYSLNRQADERGFAYWELQLSRKTTSPEKFVGNLLSEKEFINLNTTTTAKIEALYQVIVNRKSDATGLKYWTDKFDALQKNGYSDSSALGYIVNEMVNESEFQAR
ncbi:hypothetical protein SFB2_054G0, partial [Candidatus Arthromitus sp. SFB-2]